MIEEPKLKLEPYDFCQEILSLNNKPFDLSDYPYLKSIYNTNSREVGLFTARQVSKSTTLASLMVAHAVLNPKSAQLYVSPLEDQAKVFSTQRLKDFLEDSPLVHDGFFSGNITNQVHQKILSNGAMISCGFAQRTADRLRGRSAGRLKFDEVQDIMSDVIQVVKRMAFRVLEPSFWYCGTPKSLGNHMEGMRGRSTAAEWAVKCQQMGCGKWNMTWAEKNIGNHGVICEFCGRSINTNLGQWVKRRELDFEKGKDASVTMESYRVSQLICKPIMDDPFKWRDLLKDVREMSTALLYNEVFGLPFDSGIPPVTLNQLMHCCVADRKNEIPAKGARGIPPLVMGVDWAFHGIDSYTYVVIGAWNSFPHQFDVYYHHCFKGAETDSLYQIKEILRIAQQHDIYLIGADYGAGQVQNLQLINELGEQRVAQMWHTGMIGRGGKTQRAKWEPKTRKWHLARTPVLTDTFEMLRKANCRLPRAEDNATLFDHLLAVSIEFNEKTNTMQYVHIKPDDATHALTYAMLAGELLIQGNFGAHAGSQSVSAGQQSLEQMADDGWGVPNSFYQ